MALVALSSCRALLAQGLKEVAVDARIAVQSVKLNSLPSDLADRIIVSTALNQYQLLTADQAILDWSGDLSRVNARI